MSAVRNEFNSRAAEIEAFFDLMTKLASDQPEITFTDDQGERRTEPVNADAVKVFKGAGFLVLYNLVESTMTNGIVAIFDELKQKKVRFESARAEIRAAAIRNMRRNGPDDVHARMTDVALDLLTISFKPSTLFSGNLDARKVRDAAEEYGFESATDAKITKDGTILLNVKTNRNDLAHGDKSFAEVGREHDGLEMSKIKAQVVSYLGGILANIERYISTSMYLASTASGRAPASPASAPPAPVDPE